MEHPVGQAAHLGVAALAGMRAQSAWQGDYLLECQQHRRAQDVSALSAVRVLIADWVKLPRFAHRADKVVGA
jgi:hypothetical protein